MMRLCQAAALLVTCWVALGRGSHYCPYQHKHLGTNILNFHGVSGPGGGGHDLGSDHSEESEDMPRPSFWTAERLVRNQSQPTIICPSGCLCTEAEDKDIEVVCSGHYSDHFPLDGVPVSTAVLVVTPASPRLHNQLTLSPSVRRLRNLTRLDITHSGIPNIGKRTLYGLSQLRSLNLSHNSISRLVDANFDGLSGLTSLGLGHNRIESVTSAAFHHLASLEQLRLEHNSMRELAPRIFYKLEKLKLLDLSHNSLLVLDEEVLKDIRGVQELRCASCGLASLRVTFSLRLLRRLDLADNRIEAVEDIEPHILRGLASLDLAGNRISKVDKLDSLMQIEVLDLSRNRIESIAECAFCSCSKLTHIDISSNGLLELGNMFGDRRYEKLKYLSLSHNLLQVPEIRQTIRKFPNLESLHLSKMNIISLPEDTFSDNPSLATVNLSSNYLVTIDTRMISSLTNLRYLDLSFNLIMGLKEDFFKAVDGHGVLSMVELAGNPWVCDSCHILPLRTWLRSSLMYWGACFPRPDDGDPARCLRCAAPGFLAHVPVEEVVLVPDCAHTNPDYSSMTATITTISQYFAVSLLVVVVSALAVVLVTKYRHYGVYVTGEEDDKEASILTDPIHVLDRESESYVNLRYPH